MPTQISTFYDIFPTVTVSGWTLTIAICAGAISVYLSRSVSNEERKKQDEIYAKAFASGILIPIGVILLLLLAKPFAESPVACHGDECMPYPGGYKGERSIPLILIGPCIEV